MIIYFRKIVYNILTFLLTITLILGVSIFTYGTFYFAYMPSEVPRLSLSLLARGVPGARRGCQLPVPALPGQSGAVRLPQHEPQAGHQAAQADGRPALQTLPQPRAAGVLGEPGTGGYRWIGVQVFWTLNDSWSHREVKYSRVCNWDPPLTIPDLLQEHVESVHRGLSEHLSCVLVCFQQVIQPLRLDARQLSPWRR